MSRKSLVFLLNLDTTDIDSLLTGLDAAMTCIAFDQSVVAIVVNDNRGFSLDAVEPLREKLALAQSLGLQSVFLFNGSVPCWETAEILSEFSRQILSPEALQSQLVSADQVLTF